MTGFVRRHPVLVFSTLVALPLVVAGIALIWRPWVPVLDMAMTELRVRDVGGRFTPLVGLPGRIGDFPDQGSHPGPWSFYLVAPFYRLAASTAWGMQLGSIVINAAAIVLSVWLGARRWGARGAAVFAVLTAILVRGYGLTILTHPWNPYFPVLIWFLALVAAWAVLSGDHWMALIVVAATTIAAQTHVPYLVSAIAIDGLVIIALVVAIIRERRSGSGGPVLPLVAMFGVGAVLWLPPFAQQLFGESGNIGKLVDHFATDSPEPPIGLGSAAKLTIRHLDVFTMAWDLVAGDDALVRRAGDQTGPLIGGLVVLALWLASIGFAVARRHRHLLALHAVVATAFVVGFVSISRIFGKVWFYLTLWMSSAALLMVLSIVWAGWLAYAQRRRRPADRTVIAPCLAVIVVLTAMSVVAAIGIDVPEDDLAEDVRVIMPTVTAAIDGHVGAATGHDGSYVVFWQESIVPGSQGYALLNELERRGYRVGVHPTWRIPATPHRVRLDGEYDAEVHLVSGAWIDQWRGRPGHVEVIEYDDRTDAERARFDELEARVDERLAEIGRTDLIEIVDLNIFGASLDPDLPDDIVADLAEMLLLGEPVAVFIAPAGSTF